MSWFVKLIFSLSIFFLASCSSDYLINAIAETEPVASSGDAADDPAIVINFSNPAQSLIFWN